MDSRGFYIRPYRSYILARNSTNKSNPYQRNIPISHEMKKYRIYGQVGSWSYDVTIEGILESYRNHYYIKDKDGKSHYYPMCSTRIDEI